MLDFVKAMEIAERACNYMKDGCGKDCPCFDEDDCSCSFWCDNGMHIREWKKVENRLNEWDKEHQEPKYPTWREWQSETFPGATHAICPRGFLPREMWRCGGRDCDECMCEEIPADIAKKLGIKPKEE